MTKLYSLDCDPMCGFHLDTHNEKEAIRMGMEHVTDIHPDMKVTIKDVKGMIKSK
jgi:hypothetical protein